MTRVVLISCFCGFGDVREISYFAALRLHVRLSLSRVSNSSRLEAAADPADWLLRVSLSGFHCSGRTW